MLGMMEANASSLEALSNQYLVIVNNLANSNTAGYKRRMTKFVQALQDATNPVGGASTGAQSVSTELLIDHTQGALTRTDRPMDLALSGGGYFVLETPEGPLYSRNGAFRVNSGRQLVDISSRAVAGKGGPLALPPDTNASGVTVSPNGTVSAGGQQIGELKIVEFEDPHSLVPAGENCFWAPEGVTPMPAQAFEVHQGFQEASNVNAVQELAALITVTRLYEANVKSISVQDEQMETILKVAMG